MPEGALRQRRVQRAPDLPHHLLRKEKCPKGHCDLLGFFDDLRKRLLVEKRKMPEGALRPTARTVCFMLLLVEKRKMPEGALRRSSTIWNVLRFMLVEKRKMPEGALRHPWGMTPHYHTLPVLRKEKCPKGHCDRPSPL